MIIYIVFLIIIIILLSKKKSTFGNKNNNFNSKNKIGIVSMMYKPKNIDSWLEIHRKLGISHFYIRLEDTPELIDYLKKQPDVTLEIGGSTSGNQYRSLMDRQMKMMEDANQKGKNEVDWLIHIDCDEILDGNLKEIIDLPESVDTFWMQNHEAVYSSIPKSKDTCFQAKYFKDCGKPNSGCVSYINGKGGSRVLEGIKVKGPHRYKGMKREVKLNNVIVKHFESCDFDQYITKYQRYQKDVNLESIPFKYYRDSILAKNDLSKLKETFIKYSVANN